MILGSRYGNLQIELMDDSCDLKIDAEEITEKAQPKVVLHLSMASKSRQRIN